MTRFLSSKSKLVQNTRPNKTHDERVVWEIDSFRFQLNMTSYALILKAAAFAAEKHRDQRRKDVGGTPYINHPIGVADLLASVGKVDDPEILAAALLHDTVEDTNTSLEELEERFGARVRRIVSEVTDDKSLPKAERKRLQIRNAAHKSDEAKLVKLADKLHNLQDLRRNPPKAWSPKRVQGYFVWASFVVRGLRETNQGLESALDVEFAGEFEHLGVKLPCLPNGGTDLAQDLQDYLSSV